MSNIEYLQLLNGLEKLNWNSPSHIKKDLMEKLYRLCVEDILEEHYSRFIDQIERIYTFQPESNKKEKAEVLINILREKV